jgi:GDPmannose 4,6-dehydratase
MKTALITGVLGQDGTYLAEYLLGLGYRVFGLTRRNPETSPYISGLKSVDFIYGDLYDKPSLETAIWKAKPDEIYNFAGQVFVPVSWSNPAETFDVNVGGLSRILEIVSRLRQEARVYQASSSEMYGDQGGCANEKTQFSPNSPYGVSKLAAHHLCQVYKKAGTFIVSGICFNHESPRRGPEMVTQKIVAHVARWVKGSTEKLRLGNLDARRDWGYARDYVEAMHSMLQNDQPVDYVIGTGESHSVSEFVKTCVEVAGLGANYATDLVSVDQRLVRTNDIRHLKADPLLIHNNLGWKSHTSFRELVRLMIEAELVRLCSKTEERVEAYHHS